MSQKLFSLSSCEIVCLYTRALPDRVGVQQTTFTAKFTLAVKFPGLNKNEKTHTLLNTYIPYIPSYILFIHSLWEDSDFALVKNPLNLIKKMLILWQVSSPLITCFSCICEAECFMTLYLQWYFLASYPDQKKILGNRTVLTEIRCRTVLLPSSAFGINWRKLTRTTINSIYLKEAGVLSSIAQWIPKDTCGAWWKIIN